MRAVQGRAPVPTRLSASRLSAVCFKLDMFIVPRIQISIFLDPHTKSEANGDASCRTRYRLAGISSI